MQRISNDESKKYSSTLLSMIKNEEFPKYHMPNRGENYTGGRENNARDYYNIFLGSCAYAIYFDDNFVGENSYVG